ncbi:hypothetical protein ACLB1M_14640 [Escherichia coli]
MNQSEDNLFQYVSYVHVLTGRHSCLVIH